MRASRDFFAGLGCLAYVLSKADGKVEEEEIRRYGNDLLKRFGEFTMSTNGTRAIATFESCVNEKTDPEAAYKQALSYFRLDPNELKTYQDKVLRILHDMAYADQDISQPEISVIERFERDIKASTA
jgi:uncharacterized tellurite resistance protein B-like protein